MNITKENFFPTPIWRIDLRKHLKDLNKYSDPYIKQTKKVLQKEIKNRDKNLKKKVGDRYMTYHSTTLLHDPKFFSLQEDCSKISYDFLTESGFSLKNQELLFTELWVQEFSSAGGGYHSPHVHWNQHVSGFYFLKCSDDTSKPLFHDPRTAAVMTKLKTIDDSKLTSATSAVRMGPYPGELIVFPGYITHEFIQDLGQAPFRFIHFNIQVVPARSTEAMRIDV